MERPIITYHYDCHDGITALWAALRAYPDGEPYAGRYDVPPDLERMRGRDVIIVDFSWKRGPMMAIADVANSVMVIDHHKSAQGDLDGIDHPRMTVHFDMERSGAGMAWDILHPGKDRPSLINYVEDRDLWRFALEGSREVHAACSTYPTTLGAREILMERPIPELIEEGKAVLRHIELLVKDSLQHAHAMRIVGHDVLAVHHPNRALQSEIAGALAEVKPFGVVFVNRVDGMTTFSLRSRGEGGVDVAEVAKVFGGGGHAAAAGFTIPTHEMWRLANGERPDV